MRFIYSFVLYRVHADHLTGALSHIPQVPEIDISMVASLGFEELPNDECIFTTRIAPSPDRGILARAQIVSPQRGW